MNKDNIFKSSSFFMSEGDVLTIILEDLSGDSFVVSLEGIVDGVDITEDSNYLPSINMTDADGNVYGSVIIGTQMWMLQNLKTTKYNDGTPIPNITGYDDWFLPSKDELQAMYNELHLYGLGGFALGRYWSSSENDADTAWRLGFDGSGTSTTFKSTSDYVRACRAFTSISPSYSLRDVGPAGGLIFWKSGNNYLEASLVNCDMNLWSNVIHLIVGTTNTTIGTGQANTTAIINQVGHVTSAAKLCDDLIAGGWVSDIIGAYCWYNNDIANKNIYGALYNSYAADNAHGLAPTDWRIPVYADFVTLRDYLGGASVAGGKLKETGLIHWTSPNAGATNISGFTAPGAGVRSVLGAFVSVGDYEFFWGSTLSYLYLEATTDNAYAGATSPIPMAGFSVRCVRDL